MCDHPEKLQYLTLREAATAALAILPTYGPQRPYECACGRFHLTSKGLDGNVLTDEMVRALADALEVR
jgi:hypothetical protein